jgi:hypothetical protein
MQTHTHTHIHTQGATTKRRTKARASKTRTAGGSFSGKSGAREGVRGGMDVRMKMRMKTRKRGRRRTKRRRRERKVMKRERIWALLRRGERPAAKVCMYACMRTYVPTHFGPLSVYENKRETRWNACVHTYLSTSAHVHTSGAPMRRGWKPSH